MRFLALFATVLLVSASPQEKGLWDRIAPHFAPPEEHRDAAGKYDSPLKFNDGRPVKTPEDWKARRKEILKTWHDLLGPWPPLLENPALKVLEKERVESFVRHKVEIDIAPGRKTQAYLLVPEGDGPFPAIIDVFYHPRDGAGITKEKRGQNDFGYQLAKRGFVALCIGQSPATPSPGGDLYFPTWDKATLQPLSYLAYVVANAHTILARRDDVDGSRIGVVGHSYGGKWSLFAGALYEKFAAVCISDPGIVFDEKRGNVNYWEPWYLGYVQGKEQRKRGIVREDAPRTGPYKRMMAEGRDLQELHALIAPRPFFVSGGSEDPPKRWDALWRSVQVNRILGFENRVGMHNRPRHKITAEANEKVTLFFEHFLGKKS